MGTPQNPMVVTAVLRLGGRLAPEALHRLVESRALTLPRLCARVVEPRLGAPRWEPLPSLRAEQLVSYRRSPGGERALADCVADIAAEPLDPARPPWHLWSIDDPLGTTLVARVHHVIADGVALLGVLFALSDEGAGQPSVLPGASRVPSMLDAPFVRRPKTEHPRAFAGRLGGHKRFAWTGPLPLSPLRQTAHALSAHVNDVLLADIAGALRELLLRRGEVPHGPVSALVPIALPLENAAGNHFVSAFVPLPVHLDHPVARVMAARDAMRVARTPARLGFGRLLVAGTAVTSAVGGRLGRLVERVGVLAASRGVSLVASDLVGPPVELHFGGLPITSILFASPAPGSVPIAVSAFGYAGHVRITVATDDAVIPDPWELIPPLEASAS